MGCQTKSQRQESNSRESGEDEGWGRRKDDVEECLNGSQEMYLKKRM